MNFLNFFDFENRPLLRNIIIALVAVNAVILALLVFSPVSLLPSGNSASEDPSASPGYDVGWSGYSGTAVHSAEEDEEENTEEGDTADTSASAQSTGETASEMPSSGPLLELVSDHVTLHVGDDFNFYDYIKTMRDRDGTELSRYIHLSGDVNTYVPGEYVITYRITSQVDGESASQDLHVTVTDEENEDEEEGETENGNDENEASGENENSYYR